MMYAGPSWGGRQRRRGVDLTTFKVAGHQPKAIHKLSKTQHRAQLEAVPPGLADGLPLLHAMEEKAGERMSICLFSQPDSQLRAFRSRACPMDEEASGEASGCAPKHSGTTIFIDI